MQHRKVIFDFTQPIEIHPFDEAKLIRSGMSEEVAIRDLSLASRQLAAEVPEYAFWYCLQVEPRREFAVEYALLVAEVEALVQCEPAGIVVRRGRQWVKPRTPWMPGYVLVRCVYSAAAMMALLRLRYVNGIVGGPAKPHRVSSRSINEFNEKVAELDRLARMQTQSDSMSGGVKWMVGERARVMVGPFAKFECEILSIGRGKNPRCKAVTKVLGKENPFDIPLACLGKL